MNEFKITYTRHIIFRCLTETLTVTRWDITIESDNSLFLLKAGGDSTTVPIEGLKKIEFRSKCSILTFICCFFVIVLGLNCITSLDTLAVGLFICFCGVILFLKGTRNELTFYLNEN